MPLTRTRRRILIPTLVVIVIAGFVVIRKKPFDNDRFYGFLVRYPLVRHVVRPCFVLAGNEIEFDLRIQIAELTRIVDEAMVRKRIQSQSHVAAEPETSKSQDQ